MMLWSRSLDLLVKTQNVLKNSNENLFREIELVIPSKDQLLRYRLQTVLNSNNNARKPVLVKLMELIRASFGGNLYMLIAHVLIMLWLRFLDLLVKIQNVLWMIVNSLTAVKLGHFSQNDP